MSLSDEMIAECKEVFAFFDKDEDGRIASNELGSAMRSVGVNPTKAELQAMVEEIEAGKEGVVDEALFLELVERKVRMMKPESEEAMLREAFRVFDKNQKGSISVSELRHIMTHLGEKLSEHQVEEMVADATVDTDGQINYTDLARLLFTK